MLLGSDVAGCILSKFYIKPQRLQERPRIFLVVSYRNSTSNHNGVNATMSGGSVVSYRNSTSNHNGPAGQFSTAAVVSYRNSTSNHNKAPHIQNEVKVVSYRNSTSNHNSDNRGVRLFSVVSYRNSTSNHNCAHVLSAHFVLYLIEILHQTTTTFAATILRGSCILSKFYIKPQPQKL